MPSWPGSLPQKPAPNGWSGGPQRNKISFQPEIGPSIDRRSGTAAGVSFEVTWPLMTNAQLAVFGAFFETDLIDGTLPFTWNDPVTGASHDWKFSSDEPPYQVVSLHGNMHQLSFRLMRLP